MVEAYWTDKEPDIALYHGDCRAVMAQLEPETVDAIVTDPPYELGFMGKGWDRSGIAYDVSVWRECLRVLKPGGHLLAFGGSRTYHRLACAIEDAGFDIRDQIMWLYGQGFPKSLDVSKAIDAAAGAERQVVATNPNHRPISGVEYEGVYSGGNTGAAVITSPATEAAKRWSGFGTALKPAHEPIVLARRPLVGTVAENVLKHGTGGLNIDACRVSTDGEEIERVGKLCDMRGGKFGASAGALRDDLGIVTRRTPDNGRWPANVIHDGSEEVLAGFPETTSGGFAQGQIQQPTNGVAKGIERLRVRDSLVPDSGSAARFFYIPKADKADRSQGLDDLPLRSAGTVTDRKDGSDGLNSPRAGAGRTNGSRNHHPTVKPTDLMRYLCRLITPPKGLVLDPFCGSGSTGKAARAEGFRFIGIEINEEYCALAAARCEIQQRSLFGE
jgi:DNA modification methylase